MEQRKSSERAKLSPRQRVGERERCNAGRVSGWSPAENLVAPPPQFPEGVRESQWAESCRALGCSTPTMAPHPSTLAWKIPWMEEPGRLQSMGSLRVGHD